MSNLKLLRTILRLKSLKITHFRCMHRDTELHLAVKPYKNGCRCPECGRRGRIVHQTTEFRRWEDVAVLGLRVVLWYAPKEIQCPTHGRVQEEIPWAPPHARVTYRLEWRLCALCQIMTQKAAAEILRLPTSTLSNLLHRVITRVRRGHTIRGLTTLGVDEISYCKGRKLAISEFPKWRKYLILLSFLDNSSARPVQIGGVDVNICHSRVDRSPRTPAVQFAIPSAGAILSHTDGPCGS